MLRKFSVKNYKNFQQVLTLNLSNVGGYRFNSDVVTNGIFTKLLIYGRNATGKTNLGKAITDIQRILFDTGIFDDDVFLNADSEDETAEFIYEFDFDGNILNYEYSVDANRTLCSEKLLLNGDSVFDIDFENNSIEVNLKSINAETLVIDMYRRAVTENMDQEIDEKQLPFLRWLINNVAFDNESPLLKLNSYVRSMRMLSIRFATQRIPRIKLNRFYELLAGGDNLKQFEDFLNSMGVRCKLKMILLPDGSNELYFNHKVLVPFANNASSGTIALMNLYISLILPAAKASFFYLDEFDAFYHYEMSDCVIRYMKEHFPNCQIVMTTHNTNLMNNRLMRPDCLQILSSYGSLTALCDATERELREGHNLEKMYISGEFMKYE